MIEVLQTEEFVDWLGKLRDRKGRDRILARIRRFEQGNPGVVRSVGNGVSEMKDDYGPGYRMYFTWRGKVAVLLLCGGDKDSQDRDIKRAIELAKRYENYPL